MLARSVDRSTPANATPRGRRRAALGARGFTLIELLVVIAIIGVLVAIAAPSYADYVRRGRIVEAVTRLSDQRVRMEQYFLDNRRYAAILEHTLARAVIVHPDMLASVPATTIPIITTAAYEAWALITGCSGLMQPS